MIKSSRRLDLLLLLALCFLCFFWRLGAVGLFDFNEGFYTQVAREMYLRGDYVTPRVNGIYFFDKPPLALWCAALSFRLFGVNEFAARLPVALAASLLVFLVYGFGARCFGRRAGLLAAGMTALNPMFLGTARQMTMDIHQSLWFAVAMVCFFLSRESGVGSRERKESVASRKSQVASEESRVESRESKEGGSEAESGQGEERASRNSVLPTPDSRLSTLFVLGFWAACGLGFMAKSVPGLMPIFACLVYLVLRERLRIRPILAGIRQMLPIPGLLLLVAVIAPWHYLAWRASGRVFYEEYWLLHHVKLLNAQDFSHAQPFWYYVPALLAGFFPWSLFLPAALLRGGEGGVASRKSQVASPEAPDTTLTSPDSRLTTPDSQLFLLVWVVVVFGLFSLMRSKLISYLLPMYPAAALLVGDWMARVTGQAGARRRLIVGYSMVFALALLLCIVAQYSVPFIRLAEWLTRRPVRLGDVSPAMLAFCAHLFGVVALCSGAGLALLLANRARAAVGALVAAMAGFVLVGIGEGLPWMQATMNAPLQSLAREAGRQAAAGVPLAIHIAGPRRPSVFFYLPASLFLGAPPPDGYLLEKGEKPPIDAFLASHPSALVLTDRKRAEALLAATPGLTVEAQRDRWVLLRQGGGEGAIQHPTPNTQRPDDPTTQ